jgi:hypothetical protein
MNVIRYTLCVVDNKFSLHVFSISTRFFHDFFVAINKWTRNINFETQSCHRKCSKLKLFERNL